MNLNRHKYLSVLSLIGLIVLFSCRKKDQKYEGVYFGTERHTILDSGETNFRLDTTYTQEIEITYDKRIRSSRSTYKFLKRFNNPYGEIFEVGKKSIVEHEYLGPNGGYMKFSGDSIYILSTNFSDYLDNPDTQVREFRGKRN